MIWDRDTKRSEQQSESLQLSNAVYLEDFVKLNIAGVQLVLLWDTIYYGNIILIFVTTHSHNLAMYLKRKRKDTRPLVAGPFFYHCLKPS